MQHIAAVLDHREWDADTLDEDRETADYAYCYVDGKVEVYAFGRRNVRVI